MSALLRRWRESWRMATRPGYIERRWHEARGQIIREASPLHGKTAAELLEDE